VSELRLISDRQDLLALVLRELIGRLALLSRRLAAISLHPRLLAPALQCARREPQDLTGRGEPRASGTGLMDTSRHFPALPKRYFPSSGSPQSAWTFF